MTRRSIPPSCLVCGASLPHSNPMSREYHANVLRRSGEEETAMSGEQQITWCQKHQATLQFHGQEVALNIAGIRWSIWGITLEEAIKKAEEALKGETT